MFSGNTGPLLLASWLFGPPAPGPASLSIPLASRHSSKTTPLPLPTRRATIPLSRTPHRPAPQPRQHRRSLTLLPRPRYPMAINQPIVTMRKTRTLDDTTSASHPVQISVSHDNLRVSRPDLYGLSGLFKSFISFFGFSSSYVVRRFEVNYVTDHNCHRLIHECILYRLV